MEPLTESQVLAKAVTLFKKRGVKCPLKDIRVVRRSEIGAPSWLGWEVDFVYEEPDMFLNTCLTIEVTDDGVASVRLNM